MTDQTNTPPPQDDFDIHAFIASDAERKAKERADRDAANAKGDFQKVKATRYHPRPATEIPPRDYLYGKHYARRYVSALFGTGGAGKTALEVTRALSMIKGEDLLGHRRVPKRMRVWYVNLEDPRDDMEARFAAAIAHFGLNPEMVAARLFFDSGREQKFVVARRDKRGDVKMVAAVVGSMVEEARAQGINVIIVDPFVSTHLVSENANEEIQQVLEQWAYVAHNANCAVGLVHHVNKSSSAPDGEVIAESGRGAGAFKDKTRSTEVLNVMSAKEAQGFSITPEDRFSYVRINIGKTNIAKMNGRPEWFKLESVPLGNGRPPWVPSDEIGVAVPWHPPSAATLTGANDEHLTTIQGRLGVGVFKEDVRSADWVGHLVAGVLGIDAEESKAHIKRLVAAWVHAGELARVERRDSRTRKMKWFIEAPGDADAASEPTLEDAEVGMD